MRTVVVIFVFTVCALIDASRVTTLYTLKKLDFTFNDKFFKDIVAFYRPVRAKWGRIHVNVTVVETINNFWIDFKTYRQDAALGNIFQPMNIEFTFNLCDLLNEESTNLMFQVVKGVEQRVRALISRCPVEKGTMIILPDQTLPSVPRNGQGPMIPSGFYKFTFDVRSSEPNFNLAKIVAEFQYRGFW